MWRGGGLREVRSDRPSSADPGDGLGASARLYPALALRLDCNALLLQPQPNPPPDLLAFRDPVTHFHVPYPGEEVGIDDEAVQGASHSQ